MIKCEKNQKAFDESYYRDMIQRWIPAQDGDKCESCSSPVGACETKTEMFGKITLTPRECNQCREKAYEANQENEQADKFHLDSAKCCGYQNKLRIHDGEAVDWSSIKSVMPEQDELVQYAEGFMNGTETQGALVIGSVGVGKTFLCKVLHNTLVREMIQPSCMLRMVDMSIALRKETFGDSYKQVLNEFQRVPLLIIDDYGTQKNTDWVRETFFAIIDARYENHLPTIFTTNLTQDDLEKFDSRLASRILDQKWLKQIEIMGEDVRKLDF